ncbi:MAG: hypothetical protein PF489_03620 [Salinivirgaceae bacterium]|jgi:hypothetical protein|nr:hypothetical protein [Salinivirgaceae bacterium]
MKNIINHRAAKKMQYKFEVQANRMWNQAILNFKIQGFPMPGDNYFQNKNLQIAHISLYNSWKPRWWFRWPKGHTTLP